MYIAIAWIGIRYKIELKEAQRDYISMYKRVIMYYQIFKKFQKHPSDFLAHPLTVKFCILFFLVAYCTSFLQREDILRQIILNRGPEEFAD